MLQNSLFCYFIGYVHYEYILLESQERNLSVLQYGLN